MDSRQKQWTVMVYMAGDNDLWVKGISDIQEMSKVGSTDHVNIIVQFDNSGNNSTASRYYIRRGSDPEDDIVDELGRTNTGDPKVLTDFINWGLEDYPAFRYMLVLWNHGRGWNDEAIRRMVRTCSLDNKQSGRRMQEAGLPYQATIKSVDLRWIKYSLYDKALFNTTVLKAVQERAIAEDHDSRDFLDNIELKKVLVSASEKLGRKIDVLGMDACLMSMLEVGYQMKDYVSVTVGSEETVPTAGWPYTQILEPLTLNPLMTPEEFARIIVDEYIASFRLENVTLSACDLSKTDGLANVLDGLVGAVDGHLQNMITTSEMMDSLVLSRGRVQTYDYSNNIDIYNFCDLLEKYSDFEDVKGACRAVKEAISPSNYVICSGCQGKWVRDSNGVSVYFPVTEMSDEVSKLYDGLDFAKNTSWKSLLENYIANL